MLSNSRALKGIHLCHVLLNQNGITLTSFLDIVRSNVFKAGATIQTP